MVDEIGPGRRDQEGGRDNRESIEHSHDNAPPGEVNQPPPGSQLQTGDDDSDS